jgi:hypothetical protein
MISHVDPERDAENLTPSHFYAYDGVIFEVTLVVL